MGWRLNTLRSGKLVDLRFVFQNKCSKRTSFQCQTVTIIKPLTTVPLGPIYFHFPLNFIQMDLMSCCRFKATDTQCPSNSSEQIHSKSHQVAIWDHTSGYLCGEKKNQQGVWLHVADTRAAIHWLGSCICYFITEHDTIWACFPFPSAKNKTVCTDTISPRHTLQY